MALTDKEFVLANGNPEDADKVWDTMKGVTTKVPGNVISATTGFGAAGRFRRCAAVQEGRLHHQHEEPRSKTPPTIDSMVYYIATFDSYTQNPAMIIMKDGEAPAPTKPTQCITHHGPPRNRTIFCHIHCAKNGILSGCLLALCLLYRLTLLIPRASNAGST